MKVKTQLKAGGLNVNHNETLIAAPSVELAVKIG